MELLTPLSGAGLAAAMGLLLTLLVFRRQKRGGRRPAHLEPLDTVADWQPQAARVLTTGERAAYDLLRRALPVEFMLLGQVPVSRFLRVPMRHSYADWLRRVGHLSADLLVCDAGSRVLMAVDVRSPNESARSQQRHERLTRVLRAADIRVHVWREGDLPSVAEVRATVAALLSADEPIKTTSAQATKEDVDELFAEGDQLDHGAEPVASGFYDDLDALPLSSSGSR